MAGVVNFPLPPTPFVDPLTGGPAREWLYLLMQLFRRTGGGSGGDFGPAQVVTVGDSPFTYQAPDTGSVLISGGGISRLQFSTDGTTFYAAGGFYGSFSVTAGMIMKMSYARAPAVVFFPG